MLRPRIIPCLLLHNGGLVKTTAFSDPKYVGDPINAVKIFNEKEADELLVLDIDASVTGAEPNFKLISHFAAECRMPLCYGGGIKTVEQAKRVSGLGVEKVAISSAAIEEFRVHRDPCGRARPPERRRRPRRQEDADGCGLTRSGHTTAASLRDWLSRTQQPPPPPPVPARSS